MRGSSSVARAYVTGPASDPIFSEPDQKYDGEGIVHEEPRPRGVVTWGLLWSLLARHKLRLGVSTVALVGCTTCTLSMPIFSGIPPHALVDLMAYGSTKPFVVGGDYGTLCCFDFDISTASFD